MQTVESYQKIHTCVGVMLGTLGKTRDIQTLRKLQDNLSNRLAITPVKNLSDLYDVIYATIEAVKKEESGSS
jgi:hypothetical protein